MIYNCGLVLEGGGMRGVYTRGILDYFLENDIEFKNIYGVSRGAINGSDFKSKQIGRTLRIFMKYRHDERYRSVNSLVKTGNYFNADFSYHEIPDELEPFDYKTFKENPVNFYAVIANVNTGMAEFPMITDAKFQMDIIRASASLPIISQIVNIDGNEYLDGGICDSIPLKKSQDDGNNKNVVILTQHRKFVKQPSSDTAMVKLLYKNYPEFIKTYETRHEMYNTETSYVAECEKQGNTFVIAPKKPVDLGRMESDVTKMYEWYAYGRQDAKNILEDLKSFLEDCKTEA